MTAALFLVAYTRFGVGFEMAMAMALLAMLVAITMIDLDHQIIPDVISLPGIVTGVAANLAPLGRGWLEAVLGIAVAGGIFFVIILASGGGMFVKDKVTGELKLWNARTQQALDSISLPDGR